MNKGFTLIEVLSVLIIIAILFSISVVFIFPRIEDSKKIVEDAQIKTILDAAYDYTLKNLDILPESNSTSFVLLGELKSVGLIDTNITDQETGEVYSDDTIIEIKKGNSCIVDKNCKKEGSYVFELVENSSSSNIVINLSSTDNIETNIGVEFVEPTVISVMNNSTDIKNNCRIFSNISKDKQIVGVVDTSVPGVYDISYTVNCNGLVGNKVIKVVVSDTESPTVSPQSFSDSPLSTSATSFDLMEGVSCTDNSNNCKIFTEGVIKFGVPGTYTIRYTAKDSVGNVSEPVIRLIKVE